MNNYISVNIIIPKEKFILKLLVWGLQTQKLTLQKKKKSFSIAVTKVSLLEYKRKTYKNGHQ